MDDISKCSEDEVFWFGLFDDLPEGVLHPLLIDDFEDEAETKRKLKLQAGNIYKPVDGLTQLHRALRQKREPSIKQLIDAYQEDFEKVGSYLEKQFGWDLADRVWLFKTILVASSEDECRTAKSLENKRISCEQLREAVFVLLQHPVNGEEVAILHPNDSTRLSVIQLITRLIPNGFLSWICQETNGRRETIMETAASQGLNHVIVRLHELGAPIAIPEHNPLLSACRSSKKDTIELLLNRYFDSFDCSLRDGDNCNAVIMAMSMNDPKMFDLCLEKLIAYRQQYYHETESQAFNELIRFENDESTASSAFTLCRNRVKGRVEHAIQKYGIDLSYQWKEVTFLVCMLSRKIATEFCYEGIRRDPQLLRMIRHTEFLAGTEQSFADVGFDVSYSTVRGSKGETLLHLAVEKDNRELFTKLIEAGCDPDTLDNEGNHPIHFVKSEAMLDLIIERHPEGHKLVKLSNQDGFTVLHKLCALRMEDEPLISMLKKVIDLGADVHQLTNEGESAVFFLGSLAALEMFRKLNVQLDTTNKDGETALMRHLRQGTTWMTRELLPLLHQLPKFEEHAHKYLKAMLSCTRDFFECFYQVALEQNPEVTKLMFDLLFKHSREEASRVFSKVCGTAHNYAVGKFLEFDYDLDYNYQDDYQYTPIVGLLSYMEEPNKHIVIKLLQKGVDLKICNQWGRDALLALVYGFRTATDWYGHDVGTVQLLMDHGAAVNATDEQGNTALHLAFKYGEAELVEVLVRNGADLSMKNKEGKVPLQMASQVIQGLFYFLA
uniref:Ankyrin-2 n=1 Tax=Culex pipiens TaxID=7175 RepID=A0A8D8A9H6_CULPI